MDKASHLLIAVASVTAIFGSVVYAANDGLPSAEVIQFIETLCGVVIVCSVGAAVCVGVAVFREIRWVRV